MKTGCSELLRPRQNREDELGLRREPYFVRNRGLGRGYLESVSKDNRKTRLFEKGFCEDAVRRFSYLFPPVCTVGIPTSESTQVDAPKMGHFQNFVS